MAIAYFDTNSGIAGDMTLAALVDAGADQDYIVAQIQSLGLPQVELEFTETMRHCFRALRLDVKHPPEHAHRHLSDIEQMLDRSQLTDAELDIARRLFRCIGAAEAKVHGTSIEEVHFHEVGAIDSIVDIVGVAVAIRSLGIEQIVAAPTPTGSGTIQIAHGSVRVPAPATAEILTGVPLQSSSIQAELTTPTGAAILKELSDGFGPIPSMQIQRIGYGAGHRDLTEQANLLRVMVGQSLADSRDTVTMLETNLDDVTGEQLGFAIEQIWKEGPLDVFTTAIGMKKNRPAILLSVICQPEQRNRIEQAIFQHTGSLGVRRSMHQRSKLYRKVLHVETEFGKIRVKIAWSDTVERRFAPEFEDCRACAHSSGQPLEKIFRVAANQAEAICRAVLPAADSSHDLSSNGEHDHGHDHDHGGHDHHHH